MRDSDRRYLPGGRFNEPRRDGQVDNPYDMPSQLLQDLFQRGLEPVKVFSINLTAPSVPPNSDPSYTPPTRGAWIHCQYPGNHIVIFGYDSSTLNDAVVSSAFAEVFFGAQRPSDNEDSNGVPEVYGFPLKHNRGYSGPFNDFYLRWPNQSAVSNIAAKVCVLRYVGVPWIGGESAT